MTDFWLHEVEGFRVGKTWNVEGGVVSSVTGPEDLG